MQLTCNHLDQLPTIASAIVTQAGKRIHWIIDGEMGAGKTTTIKAICSHLKVTDHVTSPTYSIINEYLTETGTMVYHFDFYRIRHEQEALDFGVEEYFDSGNICLIEWAERIPNLLPQEYYLVKIINTLDHRIFTLN